MNSWFSNQEISIWRFVLFCNNGDIILEVFYVMGLFKFFDFSLVFKKDQARDGWVIILLNSCGNYIEMFWLGIFN